MGSSLFRYGGDRRRLRATLPGLPPFALHVNWAQASQIQIAIGKLEAWITGKSVQCFRRAPLRHERLEVLVAVAHQELIRSKPSMAF